jgi:hypothetical protein
MKVFNITDVETPILKQRGLINQTLVVGRVAVKPGESADIQDEPHLVAQVEGYEQIGAMARDQLPAEYAVTKARGSTPAPEAGANLPITGSPSVDESASVPPQPFESKKGRKG